MEPNFNTQSIIDRERSFFVLLCRHFGLCQKDAEFIYSQFGAKSVNAVMSICDKGMEYSRIGIKLRSKLSQPDDFDNFISLFRKAYPLWLNDSTLPYIMEYTILGYSFDTVEKLMRCCNYWDSDLGRSVFDMVRMSKIMGANPYFLTQYGASVHDIDKIFLDINPQGKYQYSRVLSYLNIILRKIEDNNGSTCINKDRVRRIMSRQPYSFPPEIIEWVLEKPGSKRNDEPVRSKDYISRIETCILENHISGLLEQRQKYNSAHSVSIDSRIIPDAMTDEQKNAVCAALEANTLVFTGGPGTGKTYTQKTMIQALKKAGYKNIVCSAPTGKAAMTQSRSTGIESETIHSRIASGTYADADVVVIDEASMISSSLFAQLLENIKPDTKLILIGDPYQLPPIECGQPFKDLLDSGSVRCAALTKTFRQGEDSQIRILADIIKNRQNIDGFDFTDEFDADKVVRCDCRADSQEAKAAAQLEKVVEMYGEYMQCFRDEAAGKGDFISQRDIADSILVLSSMRKPYVKERLNKRRDNPLSTYALNNRIQAIVNPECRPDNTEYIQKEVEKGYPFRFYLGDKVIQNVNHRSNLDEHSCSVMNGMTGFIIKLDSARSLLTVEYNNGTIRTYSRDEIDELDLAYAMTVHKSQGSEAKAVIFPVGNDDTMMTNAMFYTAVTRAKRGITVIGDTDKINSIIQNNPQRETVLSRKLQNRFNSHKVQTATSIHPEDSAQSLDTQEKNKKLSFT